MLTLLKSPRNRDRLYASPHPISSLDYAESFYREAFKQAGIGMAMVACDGRFLNVNAAFCRLTGFTRDELLEKTFQGITHPDDLDADLAKAENLLAGEADDYCMEKRYVRADGTAIWVELHAGIVRDIEQDYPLFFVAQVVEISNRKAAEAARDAALLQTQAVLHAATHVSIIATNLEGTITVFNPGAEQMLGYAADEMIAKRTPACFHLESEIRLRGEELSRRFGRRVQGFDVFVEYARYGEHDEREWTYVRRDGTHLTVNLVVTAQRDSHGYVTGFLGIATDITQRKRTEHELRSLGEHFEALATVDALTQIDNRRSVLDKLDKCWESLGPNDSLCLMVLDVDYFKRINDRYGHPAGDGVLTRVAQIIKGAIRTSDFCGRLGGEEFLIVCPRSKLHAAQHIAERVRSQVESSEIGDHSGERIEVTVSLGIAAGDSMSASIADLMRTADRHLYAAKLGGRNRVCAG